MYNEIKKKLAKYCATAFVKDDTIIVVNPICESKVRKILDKYNVKYEIWYSDIKLL